MFSCLLTHAIVDELVHQASGCLPGLKFLLHLLHLDLHLLELGKFLLSISLLLSSSLLLGLDLGECTAPLAADLQHVGGDALRDYNECQVRYDKDDSRLKADLWSTYD